MRVGQRDQAGSWRELGRYGGAVVVAAGGVLVSATSIYAVASLLPDAVAEIGGSALYGWNMTVFLVAQVIGTALVARAQARTGHAGAYAGGFGLFAAGSLACALSPVMVVMLVGRGVQGLGAGLLTGLGFAVIHSVLPQRLWGRGVAVVSAMFGVGNIVGPALGGAFAQFGAWRLVFVVLAAAAVAMGALALRILPARGQEREAAGSPVGPLALAVAVAAVFSVAGLFPTTAITAAFVVVGLVLALGFVAVDARSSVPLLPRSTYDRSSPLRWIYLTIMFLACGVAVEMFLPLFAQDLGGLPPVVAGFFAAALSLGWAVSQVASSSIDRATTAQAAQIGGPIVLACGFALLGWIQLPSPSATLVATWWPIVFLAGAGIGAAMPHLSLAAMSSVADPEQSSRAASSIATVLTLATAVGAAVAGLLVNLGAPDLVSSARMLLTGFAVLAALGVLTAWRATRPIDRITTGAGAGARSSTPESTPPDESYDAHRR